MNPPWKSVRPLSQRGSGPQVHIVASCNSKKSGVWPVESRSDAVQKSVDMEVLESLGLQLVTVRQTTDVVEVDDPMFVGRNVQPASVVKADLHLSFDDDVVDSKISTDVVDKSLSLELFSNCVSTTMQAER